MIKKFITPAIIFIVFISFAFAYHSYQNCDIFDPGLPDGYYIACSLDGHYTTIYNNEIGPNVFKTLRGAKNWAWHWEEYKKELKNWKVPSSNYKWRRCE